MAGAQPGGPIGAKLGDRRIRKLADEIIEAQRREIEEMRYLPAHRPPQALINHAGVTSPPS